MKKNFAKLALFAALSLTGATAAMAEYDSQSSSWLAQVQSDSGTPSAKQTAPFGYPSNEVASRTINVDKSTHYLNVSRDEVVKINVDGKSTTWKFDTLGTPSFALASIIPNAMGVKVYVEEDELYLP